MQHVIKKQSVISIKQRLLSSQYSNDVARTRPERKAVNAENPMLLARKKTTRTPNIPEKAEISLAVQAVSPNRFITAELAQKYRGGFSRKGSLFNLGTIISPSLAISADIPATLGSSGVQRSRLPRPRRKRSAEHTARDRKYILTFPLLSL
jgi:hypothetical protein